MKDKIWHYFFYHEMPPIDVPVLLAYETILIVKNEPTSLCVNYSVGTYRPFDSAKEYIQIDTEGLQIPKDNFSFFSIYDDEDSKEDKLFGRLIGWAEIEKIDLNEI